MQSRHGKARLGFTALEVIGGVTLAVILSLIGVSGYRIYNKDQAVQSVSRRLSFAFSTARSYAIARNTYFNVILDLDLRVFWVDEIRDPNIYVGLFPVFGGNKIVPVEPIDMHVQVEGIQYGNSPLVTSGRQHFIIGPDGSANQEARIVLYETATDPVPDTNVYTVRLYGPTGATRVFPHQRI